MFRKSLILLAFLLGCGTASAAFHDPAYEATVPVADHTEAARNAALRDALAQVFDRVSGQGGSAQDRNLAPVIRDPTRFIDQFKLENSAEGLRVWVRFDQQAVDNTLRERGRSVAEPGARQPAAQLPGTLLWLLVREEGRVHAVGSSDEEAATVDAVARDRGLTARLPLLDLQESSRLHPRELWDGGDDELFDMARRYDTGAVLIGRINAVSSGQWRGSWTARIGNETQTWESTAASFKEALRAGIDQEAALFARRPAGSEAAGTGMVPVAPAPVGTPPGAAAPGPAAAGTGTVTVRVADVLGLNDFKRVRDYLRTVPGVTAADTVEVAPDALTLKLTVSGDPTTVADAIRAGGTLERLPGREAPGGTAPLEFRLLP